MLLSGMHGQGMPVFHREDLDEFDDDYFNHKKFPEIA